MFFFCEVFLELYSLNRSLLSPKFLVTHSVMILGLIYSLYCVCMFCSKLYSRFLEDKGSVLGQIIIYSKLSPRQSDSTEYFLGLACFIHSSGPQRVWYQGPALWKTVFPRTTVGGDGLGMIQAHYIYCALYFYYYYISPTSNRQTLGPRGWGHLYYTTLVSMYYYLPNLQMKTYRIKKVKNCFEVK